MSEHESIQISITLNKEQLFQLQKFIEFGVTSTLKKIDSDESNKLKLLFGFFQHVEELYNGERFTKVIEK